MSNQNNYCTIYIVRHGQSVANAQGKHGMDSDLTDLGRQQAAELAQQFKDMHFDAAFSSPLKRAKDTAEIIAKEHNLAVHVKEALRERNEGALEGRLTAEIKEELKDLYEMRHTIHYDEWKTVKLAPDYEHDEALMQRFLTELREIAVGYPGKTVLVGSHVGLMKTLLIHLGLGTHKQLPGQAFKNTGYIVLKSDGTDFKVEKVEGLKEPLN